MPAEKIKIDLDQILEIALTGARRTSAFLALGINAARDPNVTNVHLSTIMNLSDIPSYPDAELVALIKLEFEAWVIGAGLQDLLGAFSVFLDRIFDVCTLSTEGGAVDPASLPSTKKRFSGMSVPEKLADLDAAFGIRTVLADVFQGLKGARNCYAHRLGIIGPPDVKNGPLVMRWSSFDIFGRLENGTIEQIPPDQETPFGFSDAAKIELRPVLRERPFTLGMKLQLSPRELSEIVWTVRNAAQEIKNSTVEWAKAAGIAEEKVKPVTDTPNN